MAENSQVIAVVAIAISLVGLGLAFVAPITLSSDIRNLYNIQAEQSQAIKSLSSELNATKYFASQQGILLDGFVKEQNDSNSKINDLQTHEINMENEITDLNNRLAALEQKLNQPNPPQPNLPSCPSPSTCPYDHSNDTPNDYLPLETVENNQPGTVRAGLKILAGSNAIGTETRLVSVQLEATPGASGPVTVTIRDNNDVIQAQSIGTLDASTLSQSSYTVYNFKLNNLVPLKANWHILVEYDNTSLLKLGAVDGPIQSGYNWSAFGSGVGYIDFTSTSHPIAYPLMTLNDVS